MITDSAERPRRVSVSASTVTVFVRTAVMARHQRAVGKGVKVLDLNHYLEILLRKPGALPGATALAQARASGVFTPTHEAFWAAARKALGDAAGIRMLVEVLLLHRHLAHAGCRRHRRAVSVGSSAPMWSRSRPAKPPSSAACNHRRSRRHHACSRWSASPNAASPRPTDTW